MGWELGQQIIDRLRFKKRTWGRTISIDHAKYGKIYYPNYNLDSEFINSDSNLYNEFGEKLEVYFIRDVVFANCPYRSSRYFLWDRYNFGLDTHFYSHNLMLETMGNPSRKYGLLIESEAIMNKDVKMFDKHKTLAQDFDLIFTHSAKILDKYDNARFIPFAANLFDTNLDELSDNAYLNKTKNVSILSSNKLMCDLHKFRYDLAWLCKNEKIADTYGTFDGGPFVKSLSNVLRDYRYFICLENEIQPYYFSERLISCLAHQTVPIYLGATEIDKFFNPDGIIKITTKSDIKEVLKECTKEEYEARIPAIVENYHKALEYSKNHFDTIYEKYLKK